METILISLNIVAAFLLIGVVLMQHGKGAEMGSGFGQGSSGSIIGGGGSSGNFLTRLTSILATVFFATAFLIMLTNAHKEDRTLIDQLVPEKEEAQNQVVDTIVIDGQPSEESTVDGDSDGEEITELPNVPE